MKSNGTIMMVEARFYDDIADQLADGAIRVLEVAGYDVERIAVPGVFEIPAAVQVAWLSGKFSGCVAIGCVIRGETDHYDHICREVSRALMDHSLDHTMPLGFGVLTCENRDQAWVRADTQQRNIGGRAGEACLRMIKIHQQYSDGQE